MVSDGRRLSRSHKAVEHLFVQELIPQPGAEAFDEAVLLRLARRDVVLADPALVLPFEDGTTGQLRSVVADHKLRLSVAPDHGIQFVCKPAAGGRCIRHQHEAFARVVIDHLKDAEPPADAERVRQEVESPAFRGT